MNKHFNFERVNSKKLLPVNLILVGIDNFELHFHREIEIVMVLKGSIKLRTKNTGVLLKEGDFFIINSYEIHGYEYIKDNILVILQFSANEIAAQGIDEDVFFENTTDPNPKAEKRIKKYISNIAREFKLKRKGFELNVKGYFYMLLGMLIQHYQTESDVRHIKHNIGTAIMAVEYINENYNKSISLNSVAMYVNMSPSRFTHFFKEFIGMSYTQYLLFLRVEKAKHFLAETDNHITKISFDVGFVNSASFYRAFKKQENITPVEYRKQHQKHNSSPNKQGYVIKDDFTVLDALSKYII